MIEIGAEYQRYSRGGGERCSYRIRYIIFVLHVPFCEEGGNEETQDTQAVHFHENTQNPK